MSSCIKPNGNIYLTRGDTFAAVVTITDDEDTCVTLEEGSELRFALKADYEDPEALTLKAIPIDTMLLKLDPEDTKNLDFGTYVYDIQLTHPNGDVDTVIPRKMLHIVEEVE